jgi:hypothetical protein
MAKKSEIIREVKTYSDFIEKKPKKGKMGGPCDSYYGLDKPTIYLNEKSAPDINGAKIDDILHIKARFIEVTEREDKDGKLKKSYVVECEEYTM